MAIKPIRTDVSPDQPYGPEHDSRALQSRCPVRTGKALSAR